MTPTLRTATPADAPAIAHLHAESWRFAYRGSYPDEYLDGPVFEERAELWAQRFADPRPNQHVILAEDRRRLLGFACSYGNDDLHWGTLLDNLHVRPDLHRSGIGRLLVSETAAWCREAHSGTGLYLWVLEQNDRARRFYAALGGAEQETRASETPGSGTTLAIRCAWPPNKLPRL